MKKVSNQNIDLVQLENQASKRGLLLRLQVRRPFNLWLLRLVVAVPKSSEKIQLLGEMKSWAYWSSNGFQLDTIRIHPKAPVGVGHLVWAATMAWALECTPCRKARLLAIRDDESHNSRLVKYFNRRGFQTVRDVGATPLDLPLRMVWGGAGSLMIGDCRNILDNSVKLWNVTREIYS